MISHMKNLLIKFKSLSVFIFHARPAPKFKRAAAISRMATETTQTQRQRDGFAFETQHDICFTYGDRSGY